jgi:23S rRNA-/tRNA-specific pseudouridylate synthase
LRPALNKKRARWHTAPMTALPAELFEVLYEDAWLLALCKPSGWAMHRTRGDVGPWVVDALEAHFGAGLHTPPGMRTRTIKEYAGSRPARRRAPRSSLLSCW